MPMASALSKPTLPAESRDVRAIGRPTKIVSPAISPSSTVVVKSSGWCCAVVVIPAAIAGPIEGSCSVRRRIGSR